MSIRSVFTGSQDGDGESFVVTPDRSSSSSPLPNGAGRPALTLHMVNNGRGAAQIPPLNFGEVVAERIYRSDFPGPINYEFLRSLGLKTILTLVSGPYPEDYVKFIQTEGIRHISVNIPPNKEVICIKKGDAIRALAVVLDESNYPLMIHCNKGKHRTGCIVGCYRRIQGMPLDEVLSEYRVYAEAKARKLDVQYISEFDLNAVRWLTCVNGHEATDDPRVDSPVQPIRQIATPRLRG